jgi:ATP-dependent Clp protease ATP-binding subunit ClpA
VPKVSVYLPDRLAEAVRAYQIPLSAVCQKALETEVSARLPVLSLTPRVRRVLALAAREAERLGHSHVGTEHLLLALIADEEGIAAQVLSELGVSESARAGVEAVVASDAYSTSSNQCVDEHGNVLGYLLQDEEGTAVIVARDGRPVSIRRDEEGRVFAVDAEGRRLPLEPADSAPRLLEVGDAGDPVVLLDAAGKRPPEQ